MPSFRIKIGACPFPHLRLIVCENNRIEPYDLQFLRLFSILLILRQPHFAVGIPLLHCPTKASLFQEVEPVWTGLRLVARLLTGRGLLPVQSQALQAFVVASMLEHWQVGQMAQLGRKLLIDRSK